MDLAAKHGIASSSIATILKEEIKAVSVAAGVKTVASQFIFIYSCSCDLQ